MKFKNKKILVMGLGVNGGGIGVARFLAQEGAKVKVTDLKSKKELLPALQQLKKWPITYVLGKHRRQDFLETEMIVKNPAVPWNSPYLQLAQKAGIPIEMETSLFFRLCPSSQTIGVTGTKGKTTTTTLIKTILEKTGKEVVMGGNMGISLLEILKKIKKKSIVVLELSSWQLEGLALCRRAPHIALITNIHPDHLNRYDSMEDYVKAKELIFRYQKREDIVILNKNNPWTEKIKKDVPSKVAFFSPHEIPPDIQNAFPLKGEHNLENLAAALKVAQIFSIKPDLIKEAIKNFPGVSSRLELIKEIKGIKFYNDTTATNPIAAQAAISSFSSPLIWILGGAEKNLPFEQLAQAATRKKNIKAAIFLAGTATKRLINAFKKANVTFPLFGPFHRLTPAIKKAFFLAQKGDVILLSPACASFGMFQNEFDRGEKFKIAVEKITHEAKTR